MLYQDWKCYNGAVNHMWRFYCQKRDAAVTDLTEASRNAWFACNRVYYDLSPAEQDVVMQFYSAPYDSRTKDGSAQAIAQRNGMTEDDVRDIISKAVQNVAIARGLADRPRNGR